MTAFRPSRSASRIGSGTRCLLAADARKTAVSRQTPWPIDTKTGTPDVDVASAFIVKMKTPTAANPMPTVGEHAEAGDERAWLAEAQVREPSCAAA